MEWNCFPSEFIAYLEIKKQERKDWNGYAARVFPYCLYRNRGYAVAQLVEALRYKPEGRGFDCRWSHVFLSDLILPVALWPGVDSASNRNEYQESFLGVKTAGA
jgi:hypothetical protein